MRATATVEPLVVSRDSHPVSRKNIDLHAIKVLHRLQRAGYRACLVGGGVRDLMLGRRPKDFDISTDARPQQIRRLFRNSRIIGRRFRLVHVYFKDGIVEVSTFRRDPDPEAQSGGPGDLLITDDNVFGTPEQDAFRRDFTVNALFYDIADFSVIDYVGGIEDLERRSIRAIGEPDLRFLEDPVRMLRACEMAGRLDFTVEPGTSAAIRRQRTEIEKASPARLTEEIVQILRCGSATGVLRWMMDLGLLEVFLPEAYAVLSSSDRGAGELENLLPALDRMVAEGRKISDAVLLAALLLPNVLLRRRDVEAVGRRLLNRTALQSLTVEVMGPFLARFAVSNRKTEELVAAVQGFQLLGSRWRTDTARLRFSTRPGFDDALDLLELLVAATGDGAEDLATWRRIQEERPASKAAVRAPRPRRRRRRRNDRRPSRRKS